MNERMHEIKDRLRLAMDLAGKKSVDLTRDVGVPSSAMSQYLSGKSKNMPIDRLYEIAKYLNVSEAWLMGYDVPMKRTREEPPSSMDLDNLDLQIMKLYKKLSIEKKKALIQFLKSLGE